MKDLKHLKERIEYKVISVQGSNTKLKLYRFDASEILGKRALVSVTIELDCVHVSVNLQNNSLPSFEDCVKIKEYLFDEDEAVFLVLKNLRILDNKNVDIRMFYSEEINKQAVKMDFSKVIERTNFLHTKKRPLAKIKQKIAGLMVYVVSMENKFPELEELEETFKTLQKIPLICIKDGKIALNQKHIIFICDGDQMKLPKFLDQVGHWKRI